MQESDRLVETVRQAACAYIQRIQPAAQVAQSSACKEQREVRPKAQHLRMVIKEG
jgi:hypothetical protein